MPWKGEVVFLGHREGGSYGFDKGHTGVAPDFISRLGSFFIFN